MDSKQLYNGCSLCKYAGCNTSGSSIMPALSEQEAELLRQSRISWGADYYCVAYRRPVRNDDGKVCPMWKDDRS